MATNGLMAQQDDGPPAEVIPVTAIICNRNRAGLLTRCLESVSRNNPAEIIVVDGQSTDDSARIAVTRGARVITDKGRGLGYARRLGVQAASQPYVFFVDTDVVLPQADTLCSMLGELEQTGVAGLHAQVLGKDISNYWEWAQDAHFRLTFNHPGPRKAIGCVAALFRRDVLLNCGPDEYFSGASEDGDLSRRLIAAGYQLAVSASAVLHSHRADIHSFVEQRLWYGRGNGRLAWRHRAPWLLIGPAAFLGGGSFLAVRARLPQLLPYIVLHTVCVAIGSIVEYCRLARHALGRR